MELLGRYWRVSELATTIGMSYFQTYQIVRNEDRLERVGTTLLIPDDLAQELIDKYTATPKENLIPVTKAASSLGVPVATIYQLIQLGLPTVPRFKTKRIEKNVFNLLKSVIRKWQDQYSCIPGNSISAIMDEIKERLKEND